MRGPRLPLTCSEVTVGDHRVPSSHFQADRPPNHWLLGTNPGLLMPPPHAPGMGRTKPEAHRIRPVPTPHPPCPHLCQRSWGLAPSPRNVRPPLATSAGTVCKSRHRKSKGGGHGGLQVALGPGARSPVPSASLRSSARSTTHPRGGVPGAWGEWAAASRPARIGAWLSRPRTLTSGPDPRSLSPMRTGCLWGWPPPSCPTPWVPWSPAQPPPCAWEVSPVSAVTWAGRGRTPSPLAAQEPPQFSDPVSAPA